MDKFNVAKFKKENYPFLNIISDGNLVLTRYGELPKLNIDFDVYLPTFGINLQRGFVWKLIQKKEFILSIFKGILIPPVSVIVDDTLEEKKYIIIDGKQRIKTIIDFLNNKFPFKANNYDYYFRDLDTKSTRFFTGKPLFSHVLYSNDLIDPVTDVQKIQWFNFINFAGTAQDKKHQEILQNFLKK